MSKPLSLAEKELIGSVVDEEADMYDGPPHGGLRKTTSTFIFEICGVDTDEEGSLASTEGLNRVCMD